MVVWRESLASMLELVETATTPSSAAPVATSPSTVLLATLLALLALFALLRCACIRKSSPSPVTSPRLAASDETVPVPPSPHTPQQPKPSTPSKAPFEWLDPSMACTRAGFFSPPS